MTSLFATVVEDATVCKTRPFPPHRNTSKTFDLRKVILASMCSPKSHTILTIEEEEGIGIIDIDVGLNSTAKHVRLVYHRLLRN